MIRPLSRAEIGKMFRCFFGGIEDKEKNLLIFLDLQYLLATAGLRTMSKKFVKKGWNDLKKFLGSLN